MGLQNYFSTLKDQRAEAVKAIVERTGKSPACVSRWISGQTEPDYANKVLIASALGLTFKELFDNDLC